MTAANARFWTYWNGGWCKLTIKPGQLLALHSFRHTEEGYTSEHEEYTHEGDVVRCQLYTSSRDCDGPHEHHAEHYCPLDRLQDDSAQERWNVAENAGIWTPSWKRLEECQRDHYAEQAGY